MTDPKHVRLDLDALLPLTPDSLRDEATGLWNLVRAHRGPDAEIDLLCVFAQGPNFSAKLRAGENPHANASGRGDALGQVYAASMLVSTVLATQHADDWRLKAASEILRGFLRERARA